MQQDKAWLTFKFAEGQTASPVPLLPAGQRKFAARSLLRVTVQGILCMTGPYDDFWALIPCLDWNSDLTFYSSSSSVIPGSRLAVMHDLAV